MPAPAQAGSYRIYACQPPGVNVASPTRGPWAFTSTSPSNQLFDGCASGGAMAIGHLSTVAMPPTSTSTFDLAPPPAIGIAQVVNYSRTALAGSGAPGFGLGVDPSIAGPPGGDASDRAFTSLTADPPARSAQIGIYCSNGGAGAGCSFSSNPQLSVRGIVTTLVEGVAPAGAVAGGAAVAPGVKTGTALLSYSAADADSGVEKVEAVLGDTVVGTDSQARDLTQPVAQQSGLCTYTSYAACPMRLDRDLAVDTTKVPDGSHLLSLRITDAAQNRTVVAGPMVTVTNPPAPGTPNGAGATRGAKLRLDHTATRKRSRRLKLRSAPTVKGTLRNEVGQPIAGATIVLTARRRQSRAPLEQVARVRTDASGAFRHRMPAGPSRTLGASYTAFTDDPRPAASSQLRTYVSARVTASPRRRTVRVGRRLRVSGRLVYLPRSGVELILQGRDGRRWRPIDSTKTRARGRYAFSYRFKRSARGRRFALRVRVSSPIYPFTTGYSRRLSIRVR